MKLSPRIRVLLGVITSALFLVVGLGFVLEDNWILGGILLCLGAYRFLVLVRQIQWLLSHDSTE